MEKITTTTVGEIASVWMKWNGKYNIDCTLFYFESHWLDRPFIFVRLSVNNISNLGDAFFSTKTNKQKIYTREQEQ